MAGTRRFGFFRLLNLSGGYMQNDKLSDTWSTMYRNPQFHAVSRQRRRVVLTLFIVGTLFYFSIPAVTTFYPSIFHARLFGVVNIGLAYGLLQYPIGGLIAYIYAINMRKLDLEVARMGASPQPRKELA